MRNEQETKPNEFQSFSVCYDFIQIVDSLAYKELHLSTKTSHVSMEIEPFRKYCLLCNLFELIDRRDSNLNFGFYFGLLS